MSQFLAIQEKGVSAWEFEPELEIANCFVEGRTEIEFFDSACSVQSNLPVPKQNEVYYWEAKIFDKPDTTLISIGMTTKPYPLFRLPGMWQAVFPFRVIVLIRIQAGISGLSHILRAANVDTTSLSQEQTMHRITSKVMLLE